MKTMLQTALSIDKKSLFLCIAYNLIKQLMNVFYGVYFLRMILAGLETGRGLISIVAVLGLMFGINVLYSRFDQYYRNIYLPVFKLKADCCLNEKIMEKANAIPYDRANSPGELDWYNRVMENSSEMMLQAYQSFGLICGLLEAFAMVLYYLIHTDMSAILFSAFPLLYSYFLGKKKAESQYELDKKVSSAARKKEYAGRLHYLREYASEMRTSKAGSMARGIYREGLPGQWPPIRQTERGLPCLPFWSCCWGMPCPWCCRWPMWPSACSAGQGICWGTSSALPRPSPFSVRMWSGCWTRPLS